jgi:hypothetical protein
MKKARKQQQEPSKASLREMPEVDFSKVKLRPNPYAERIRAEGIILPGRGRPMKGKELGPMTTRTIRFQPHVWERVEEKAKAKGLTFHAALRTAIVEWVLRKEPSASTGLQHDPRLLARIEEARKSARVGKGIRLEDLDKHL